jgi:uncharacterized surface protein with fasciclin (FAS1) repeats
MRSLYTLLALLFVGGLALGLAACGTPAAEEPVAVETPEAVVNTVQPTEVAVVMPTEEPVVTDTVLSALEADGRFAKLISLLQETGVVTELATAGPITVLAPTDDAFAAVETELAEMTPEQLKELVLSHLFAQKLTSEDLMAMADTDIEAQSRTLYKITVDGQDIYLGEAKVVEPDIQSGESVIHVIDVVLIPEAETE